MQRCSKSIVERVQCFTLIELLIVVAIIGVLAAIAVPNFLQAQVRAKLARVQADFHSLSVAIESYNIDHNHYPDKYKFPHPGHNQIFHRFIALTTPVAYINSVNLPDPFLEVLGATGPWPGGTGPWSKDSRRFSYACRNYEFWKPDQQFKVWLLCSFGPDKDYSLGLEAELWARGLVPPDLVVIYSLTNGLYSSGDIVRTGGETRFEDSMK